ncbi:MAG: hypothetical protein COB53_01865 [Elusimicrobia bacterium]|nr:MAG: hypothetical protein COB53_01865 [Elusimicrobiota bacterium]
MKNKFYALHLHCAIGPRRDPWLGSLETDASVIAYRDSYLRAYHSCYGPNTSAVLRGEGGLVADLHNNFNRVSFDAAPELMAWLETHKPRVYRKLIEADHSQQREHGHGGALAVPHPPLILPLASRADKRTAIRWGIDDFRIRFERNPEGMWLPENAIDEETCEALIEEGIRFTLITRTQAARVRPLGSGDDDWTEVLPERLDPRRPYRWNSRERPGSWLALFVYRGDLTPNKMLAQNANADDDAVAVDGCQGFANKLVDSLTANDAAELAHLAMDAELFGLVHPYGERALAFTLDLLEREAPARLTNYASFLDLFPPPQEISLKSVSARSCSHGLERWRGICDCRNPQAPDRSPAWRGPLRAALEKISRGAADAIETLLRELTRKKLASLDAAGPLLFSHDADRVESFLAAAARRHPVPQEAQRLLRAVEIRRASLAGLNHWTWQGEDAASTEAAQALLEAARTIDVLALEMPERAAELEVDLLKDLAEVPVEGRSDAAEMYRRLSRPRRVDVRQAAVHAAISAAIAERAPQLPELAAPHLKTNTRLLCRRDKPDREGSTTVSFFEVSAQDLKIYCAFEGLAVVIDSGGVSIECWLGRVGSPESTASDLERLFVEKGPQALRTAVADLPDSQSWGLDGLLGESKRAAVRKFAVRRDPDANDDAEELDQSREALAAHAAVFSETPSADSLAALVGLLETARASGSQFNVWEIRELGRSGLARAQSPLPDEGKKALLSLLSLAEESIAREERWSPVN